MSRGQKRLPNFPWEAIFTDSLAEAIRSNTLPRYYARQEAADRKLTAYLRARRRQAIKRATDV